MLNVERIYKYDEIFLPWLYYFITNEILLIVYKISRLSCRTIIGELGLRGSFFWKNIQRQNGWKLSRFDKKCKPTESRNSEFNINRINSVNLHWDLSQLNSWKLKTKKIFNPSEPHTLTMGGNNLNDSGFLIRNRGGRTEQLQQFSSVEKKKN